MDLSVITVTYQSINFIERCILSVMTHVFKYEYEHIIIDNGSNDGTMPFVEQKYGKDVILIKNKENRGFAYSNNQGVKKAKGQFILFLNPDMEIYEGYVDSLIDFLNERKDVGIISCKLLDGFKQPIDKLRPMQFPKLLPYFASLLTIAPFFCSVHKKFFYRDFDANQIQEVDVVRGAFMLLKKETIDQLGFAFDPRYFILLEDVDLCQEIKKMGLKVVYNPSVSCFDFFGKSFLKQTKIWKYKQLGKSLRLYVKKWHSPWHLIWLNIVLVIGFFLKKFQENKLGYSVDKSDKNYF